MLRGGAWCRVLRGAECCVMPRVVWCSVLHGATCCVVPRVACCVVPSVA